jgi:hypothetical protein
LAAGVADDDCASFALYLRIEKHRHLGMNVPETAAHATHALVNVLGTSMSEDVVLATFIQQPAIAADLGQLLYTYLAWLVQLQQQQRSRAKAGNSSARGQQQQQQQQQQQSEVQLQVPPWHVHFLAAVGAPAWRASWLRVMDEERRMQVVVTAVRGWSELLPLLLPEAHAHGCTDCTAAAGSSGSSSSSSSAVTESVSSGLPSEPQQQQAGMMDPHVAFERHLPARETLLLLLEVLLLNQGEQPSQEMAQLNLGCYMRIIDILSSLHCTPANPAAAEAVADALLQPVLHLLGPALPKLAATGSLLSDSSSGTAGSSSSSQHEGNAMQVYGVYSKCVEMLVTQGREMGLKFCAG